MHHSPIIDYCSGLIIKPASIKGNAHVSLDFFQRLRLCSLQIQFGRNERTLLSLFIWLNDCWMDSSQLIRHWQAALLLAQWPTPTKDGNHQQNSRCPQIDFCRPTKPRQCQLNRNHNLWVKYYRTLRNKDICFSQLASISWWIKKTQNPCELSMNLEILRWNV